MTQPTATLEGADAPDAPGALDPSGGEPQDPAAPRLLLFGVAGRVYGCDLDAVREIVPVRRATRLPGAPHFVSGLINLRGRVVTVLDLGRHFGGGSVDPDAGSIVLIEHGARLVGLAVDEVRDVQPLRDADLDAVGGEAARDGVVRGLGRVDGGTVVVLDVRAMAARILL
jgi:purine-binding chemotaxis protein CheW